MRLSVYENPVQNCAVPGQTTHVSSTSMKVYAFVEAAHATESPEDAGTEHPAACRVG